MRRAIVVLVVVAGCGRGDDGAVTDQPGPGRAAVGALGLAGREVPGLTADSAVPVDAIWDDARNRPRLVVGAFAGGGAGDPVAVARAVLARHAADLRIAPDDLVVRAVKSGRAGTYIRFAEVAGPERLPVFDGELVASVDGDTVRAIAIATRGPIAPVAAGGDRGAGVALAVLRARVAAGPDRVPPVIERGIAIDDAGTPRLAYRVAIATDAPRASWSADVDAITGELGGLRDLRIRATGTGAVFDPNAVDATGDTALDDGNDADTAALTAARVTVTLDHLDGTGVLRGTFADARGATARATNAGLTFDFTRSAREFEEVMAYFHLDRAQQRIQDLGFVDVNNHPQVAVIDAIPDDNSFYDVNTHEIEYGTGGVDDAEDGDIVLHEYGHAIQHDQVPGWGQGGDTGAMGEAFGDYLGGGFETTLATAAGHPGLVDPACVGEWDATSYSVEDPPCLRRLDGTKHWPESADGESHDDGEVWSAALWAVRTALGADATDTLVLEHHFMLTGSATVDDASTALLAADQDMNGGANAIAIRRALFDRGVLRTPLAPADGPDVIITLDVSVDNPRTGAVYPDDLDDRQVVTLPGAAAVRVHFTQIDTEEDTAPSCLGGCDNIYLSSADGDLYQILHGTAADMVSVVVPGDTVEVRLVSDFSVGKMGYHIDRIDSMGVVGPLPGNDAAGPGDDDPGHDGGGCCQGSAGGSIPIAMFAFAALIRRPRRARRTA